MGKWQSRKVWADSFVNGRSLDRKVLENLAWGRSEQSGRWWGSGGPWAGWRDRLAEWRGVSGLKKKKKQRMSCSDYGKWNCNFVSYICLVNPVLFWPVRTWLSPWENFILKFLKNIPVNPKFADYLCMSAHGHDWFSRTCPGSWSKDCLPLESYRSIVLVYKGKIRTLVLYIEAQIVIYSLSRMKMDFD